MKRFLNDYSNLSVGFPRLWWPQDMQQLMKSWQIPQRIQDSLREANITTLAEVGLTPAALTVALLSP